MATSTGTSVPRSSTDAEFRAWGLAIHNAFAAVGLTNTSDTGQINWTTVLKPAAAATMQGYEIWRFSDTLQTAAPVYFKVEFGSGASGATTPGIRITIGSGTNGAGTLTGQVGGQAVLNSSAATATACNYFVSGASNRLVFVFFAGAASNTFSIWGCIERTKDTSGVDTTEGVMMFTGPSAGTFFSQMVPTSGAILASRSTFHLFGSPAGTSSYGGNVYLFPFRCWQPGESSVPLGIMGYHNGDITAGTTFTSTAYDGVSHTYYPIGTTFIAAMGQFNRLTLAMRYD